MSDSQKMEQLAQEVLSRHDAGEGKVVATPVPEDGSTVVASPFAQMTRNPVNPLMTAQRAPDSDYEAVKPPMSEEEFAALQQSSSQPPRVVAQSSEGKAPQIEPEQPRVGLFDAATVGVSQAPQQMLRGSAGVDGRPMGANPMKAEEVVVDQDPTDTLDDDDDAILTGSGSTVGSTAPEGGVSQEIDPRVKEFGEAAVKAVADLPEDAREKFFTKLRPESASYQKELVTVYGYTPDEALKATRANMGKRAEEFALQYKDEHPDAGIIKIDKTQEEQLQFTDEEKAKLFHTKALKLVVVEDAALKAIDVLPDDRQITMDNMYQVQSSLTTYSIPLIDYGDYATFNGCSSFVMSTLVEYENDTELERIEKRAHVLYDYFGGSRLLPAYKSDGTRITFSEFCNHYAADDVDMGLYAVACASSMEKTRSVYACLNPNCNMPFDIEYSQKQLLDLSGIPEAYAQRIEAIDAARGSVTEMEKLHKEYWSHTRVESPLTHNIYEIGHPTLAQDWALRIVLDSRIRNDPRGFGITYSAFFRYLRKIWLYEPNSKKYYPPVTVDVDPEMAAHLVDRIYSPDLDMIRLLVAKDRYRPRFFIRTKCPHCKREARDEIFANDMLFLFARGTSTEIE